MCANGEIALFRVGELAICPAMLHIHPIELRPNDLARALLRNGLTTFPKSRIEDAARAAQHCVVT
jgi:hypothetical protein